MKIYFRGVEYNNNETVILTDSIEYPIRYVNCQIYSNNKKYELKNGSIVYDAKNADDRTAALLLLTHFLSGKIHGRDISIEEFDRDYCFKQYPMIRILNGYINAYLIGAFSISISGIDNLYKKILKCCNVIN